MGKVINKVHHAHEHEELLQSNIKLVRAKIRMVLGEVYIVSSKDGAARGGHYHKQATEWFTLLTGNARLEMKDIRTNETMAISLSALKPVTIVVPAYIAHRFDTISNEAFILLAYTDFLYTPDDTIELEF